MKIVLVATLLLVLMMALPTLAAPLTLSMDESNQLLLALLPLLGLWTMRRTIAR